MDIALHTVFNSGSSSGRSGAVARSEPPLGLCMCADATVGAQEADPDLASAASSLVLDTVRAHISKHGELRERFAGGPTESDREQLLEVLQTAVGIASREVNALARRRKTEIAVTLDAVLAAGDEAFIAHVGDGRIYLLRKGLVHKLTQDHVDEPDAAAGDSPSARSRQDLERALGPSPQVQPETLSLQLSDGDRLLIASPWLHRGLDDLGIREIARDHAADGIMARLIGAARGGGIEADLACALLDVGDADQRDASTKGRLATLARIPLFAYCTERELLAIAGVTRPIRYRRGAVVFREGEPGRGLFLVVAGEVAILKDEQEITRMGAGANFGEMSMLDEPTRSATVEATQDSELLLITRDAFFSLLKRDPTLAVKVLWNMLLRLSASLRATSERLSELSSLLGQAREEQ